MLVAVAVAVDVDADEAFFAGRLASKICARIFCFILLRVAESTCAGALCERISASLFMGLKTLWLIARKCNGNPLLVY